MHNIFVILAEDGSLGAIHTNDEINVKILQRGRDDNRIDEVESSYDSVEIE